MDGLGEDSVGSVISSVCLVVADWFGAGNVFSCACESQIPRAWIDGGVEGGRRGEAW